ncbi:MAG: 50S ribosomal protein L22 [Deltaproteobacteria bacterium]|nr:50S ribosomal protein L22 [Deltaproteobacteria bacterium]MBI2975174.1 50S ribosomal protein L22 [Deltaproteobacteria bacterium]
MYATFKHLRISPQKMRCVVNLVRGKKVNEAVAALKFCKRSAARPVLKLVQSAAANARVKGGVDQENLYLKKIVVDNGPIVKRFRARSRGMAHRILKRACHISVELGER